MNKAQPLCFPLRYLICGLGEERESTRALAYTIAY